MTSRFGVECLSQWLMYVKTACEGLWVKVPVLFLSIIGEFMLAAKTVCVMHLSSLIFT